VNACEVTLRLGSTASGQPFSAVGQGFHQLLQESIQQVVWASSASLVCAVADKLTSCAQQVADASLGMQHMQQQWKPWRLSSRNNSQCDMSLGHVGSALDVLSHAWEVLSADDALISAAAQHSSTLLSSVKRWMSFETETCKQTLDALTLLVLLHVSAVSAGLKV
jgi:hypothetical protein